MAEFTTGLIHNKGQWAKRPISTFSVRVKNKGPSNEVVNVKGFYIKHHKKKEYISEVIALLPQSQKDKKYYAEFDELEFQLFTTSENVDIFAWGRSKVGRMTKYEVKKLKTKSYSTKKEIQNNNTLPMYLYIPNPDFNTVSVIESVTKKKVTDILVGTTPINVGVNPITNRIYVVNKGSSDLTVIDGISNKVITTIVVGKSPEKVTVDSEQNKVFVYNGGSNNTSVISGRTYTVIETIDN